jgi:hypothetical protein
MKEDDTDHNIHDDVPTKILPEKPKIKLIIKKKI